MSSIRPGDHNLEMNHTHFLLLDDGILGHYNIGDYRTRLTKIIANTRTKQTLPGREKIYLFKTKENQISFSPSSDTSFRRWRRFSSVSLQ